MAPSFVKALGSAVAVLPALASASDKVYKVSEVYDSSNFFDKFNFISTADPTGGYVQYQSRDAAEELGLVSYQDGEAYIGVEHGSGSIYDATKDAGRKSVRLESKTLYNHGLVIAEFSYLPKPTCGSWPAFWFFGEPWPTKGEIDLYENWNDLTFNRHTAHVDSPDVVGQCIIAQNDMSAVVDSANCYDHTEGQADFQGCSASEYTSTFGSSSGGVYAMEWTSEYLKIWDWERASAPLDVKSGSPAPSADWGTPAYVIQSCEVDKAFKDMKMVLNLDFCGVAGQSDKWDASCSAATTYDTCAGYVAENPEVFADTFFKVKDITFYELVEEQNQTSSSTATTASSTSASSSTVSSTSSLTTTSSTASATASTTSATTSSISATASSTSVTASSISVTSSSAILSASSSSFSTVSHFTNSSLGGYPTIGYPTIGYPTTIIKTSPPATTEEAEFTTSTIYATNVHTITSCPASVTDCPNKGSVVTETVSVGTTVCPVTKTTTGPAVLTTSTGINPKPTTTTAGPEIPEGYTTRTVSVTKMYTISKCPSSVTNCPLGAVTTEVSVTTTTHPVISGQTNQSTQPTGVPTTNKPVVSQPAVSQPPTVPGSEGGVAKGSTTTLCQATTRTSTRTVSVTQTVTRTSSFSVSVTDVDCSEITSTSTEQVVYLTATVVPVPSSPSVEKVPTGGFTNSTGTYPTTVAPPQGATTGSIGNSDISNGSTEGIVEVSAGVRMGASVALMAIAGFFFYVM